jgi:hypothetical protein
MATPLCINERERSYVEALLVYCTYKRDLGESPIKATGAQIRELMEERHRVIIEDKQLERLKRKYITRVNKPASTYELLVQTAVGSPGSPSEFKLAGILKLMGPSVLLGCPEGRCGGEEVSADSPMAIAS